MAFWYPLSDECVEFYRKYIEQVPDTDILAFLKGQSMSFTELRARVSEERSHFRYAEGKWSIRQVFGHLADTERVFLYRAMVFARADKGPLPGMDENGYVDNANFDARPLAEIYAELIAFREASIAFLQGINSQDILERRGVASGCEFTVNSLAYIIAGHAQHHLTILENRYLVQ